VNFENSGNFVNTSRGELEFACYKEFKEPQKKWISYFNNPDGQKSFNNYKVDLWSPDGEVYQFYGCEFHYHLPPKCTINVGKNEKSENCKKISYLELKKRDEKTKNEILEKFSHEVFSFKTMFECEWKNEKKKMDYRDFQRQNEHFLKRPLNRLVPRTSVRSGLSDVYYLRWEKSLFPDEEFIYSDVQGLYSKAAIDNEFPIGQYDIFLGLDLTSKISFRNGYHYYLDKKLVCGSAFVKVQAPSTLFRPFLQFRVKDQYNFLALCQACCMSKSKKCSHFKLNCFESTWMFSDLRKATSLGYKILAWYEIHYFSNTAPILKEYSQILYSEKIKNSGFPSNIVTTADKLNYCNEINLKLQLPNAFKLTPENVTSNQALRQLAKSQLNNLYGKFCQNSNQTETIFVKNQFSLEELFRTKKILDVINVLEETIQVEAEHIHRKPQPKSNMYIGAQIR